MPDLLSVPPTHLQLSREQVLWLTEQIAQHPGEEVCGLIAGRGATAARFIAIPNRSQTPQTHFQMDENKLFQALKSIDDAQETLLATYHTHPKPHSASRPSQADIVTLGRDWPHTLHVIAVHKQRDLHLKAWHIAPDEVISVPITVDSALSPPVIQERLSSAQQVAIILATILSVALVVIIAITLLPPPPDLTLPLR
ncbi:Mov34/MPN/PAD-1 family protein [Phototrophicus methaneseepsis]|uniref:Mov34/MPN/PAD-1 family protein n=1 Tax=Phototrophicus methaneseepsis TaxID=2710758 RepID=A0A7S8E677_9CHLR|nr:Mov34/MPN/PAD-1 family protein [Phototrophicus methaneseepsis]QPC81126.1 Mov34/MPN/PAD-1 family protein [Phototrophicus methaneseepsis]